LYFEEIFHIRLVKNCSINRNLFEQGAVFLGDLREV